MQPHFDERLASLAGSPPKKWEKTVSESSVHTADRSKTHALLLHRPRQPSPSDEATGCPNSPPEWRQESLCDEIPAGDSLANRQARNFDSPARENIGTRGTRSDRSSSYPLETTDQDNSGELRAGTL